jgi:hypothetical protein
MNSITYNGKVLTATMTVTFQTKSTGVANGRAVKSHMFRGDHRWRESSTYQMRWRENDTDRTEEKRDDLCNGHIDVPGKAHHRPVSHPNGPGQETYQILMIKATMMSSFRMSTVNEMETMFRNSFSNRIKDMVIIADPIPNQIPKEISILTQNGRVEADPW